MKFLIVFIALIAAVSASGLTYSSYGLAAPLAYAPAPLAYAPVAKYAALPAVTSITTHLESPAKILAAPAYYAKPALYAPGPYLAAPAIHSYAAPIAAAPIAKLSYGLGSHYIK